MMEASDAADPIREATDEGEGDDKQSAAERHEQENQFRKRAAVVIAVLAALLAITALGGENATKETINTNIQSSDTYAFFQAKNIRQTSNQLAAEELQSLLEATNPSDAGVRAAIQGRIDRYRATVQRYESDPQTGEGKAELLAKAQGLDKDRERAQKQDPNFDYAQALFQISIVLGSVAIVAVSRRILLGALVLGAVALVFMLNGFMLWFNLPA